MSRTTICHAAAPLLAAILSSCASITPAPAWFPTDTGCEQESRSGDRLFCATATGTTPELAREAAEQSALARASAQLGTVLTAALTQDSRCDTLRAGSREQVLCTETVERRVQSAVKEREFRNVRHPRTFSGPERELHRAWTQLVIPAAEWSRQVRLATDRTIVALDCRMGSEACPDRIVDQLTAALAQCRFQASGDIERRITSAAEAARLGDERSASRVLFLSLRAESREAGDGLIAAEGTGRWELIDADGRTVRAKGIPSRRSGERSAPTATELALRKAVERLSMISCGLSEAAGSLCCAEDER